MGVCLSILSDEPIVVRYVCCFTIGRLAMLIEIPVLGHNIKQLSD